MPNQLKQSACDYFLLLSRIEYALKNSGFVIKDDQKDGSAKPDWERFKDEVYEHIAIDTSDEDVREIMQNRPARQIYTNNKLDWSKPQKIGDGDKKALIDACLTIRNNLFHGGKHGDGNAGRNEILIRAATKILNQAVAVCPKVKEKFDIAEL